MYCTFELLIAPSDIDKHEEKEVSTMTQKIVRQLSVFPSHAGLQVSTITSNATSLIQIGAKKALRVTRQIISYFGGSRSSKSSDSAGDLDDHINDGDKQTTNIL